MRINQMSAKQYFSKENEAARNEMMWSAIKEEIVSMVKRGISNADIRLRICAIWSISLSDNYINDYRKGIAA